MNFNFLDFDMYSKRIGFFYKNKDRMGSRFGFCLTIIYVFVSLGLFIFYTSLTIKRIDIKVHDSTMYLKEESNINIDPNLFYFAFGVENPNTSLRFIDETIYYPKVTYFEKIKEGSNLKTIEEKNLNIERCKEEKFGEKYQNLLVKGELNNSYCINDINLSLTGGLKHNKITYIKIGIYACVNTTENNNHCKPKEVINDYISGTFFSFLAKDIGLDPSNYSDPIIPTLQDLHTTIDKNFFRDFILYFGLTEVQTDVGLFYEKIHKEIYLNFIKTTQAFYYRDEQHFFNGENMCEIQFRLGDDIRVQKRSFMKMTEVFAITGGYMQLIATIFKIISLLNNKLSYEIKLVNTLFNIIPKKKKIELKYKLENQINIFEENKRKEKNFSLYRTKKINLSTFSKKQKIQGIDKNSANKLNFNEYIIHSINLDNNNNSTKSQNMKIIKASKTQSEENKSQNEDKIKESSFNEESRNKSKMSLLNLGVNFNSININRIQKNKKINNSINLNASERHSSIEYKGIKMNILYYYCFSKCKNNKEDIYLFDLAISFYKKKMDIIHLFYIILLIEKISKKINYI